eukprot:TRINITY_DN12307_c0_g2_i2.p1 TRINITY_DN12307_c0_g2~~TRINITY_DN12307_c0_g2_i2.p1  ORF type:complete len:321 (+),score=60.31 TRINITY_DN12307_c0_g2_i2:64-1026(+)
MCIRDSINAEYMGKNNKKIHGNTVVLEMNNEQDQVVQTSAVMPSQLPESQIKTPHHHNDSDLEYYKGRLQNFKTELRNLLLAGVPSYEIRQLTPEQIERKIQCLSQPSGETGNSDAINTTVNPLTDQAGNSFILEGEDTTAKLKKLMHQLLVAKIENSRLNLAGLAKECLSYLNEICGLFKDLTENDVKDAITAIAKHTRYDVKHEISLDESRQNDFVVWEIRDQNMLADVADIKKVSRVRKERDLKQKLMKNLQALIKSIEEANADLESIETKHEAYKTAQLKLEQFIEKGKQEDLKACLLYTSPSPRDGLLSRMPSSA